MFVSVVLYDARPVNVRQQRRVLQAHHFNELWRTQQDLVTLLGYRRALRVDAVLHPPDARKPKRNNKQKQPREALLRFHFKFRRENTAAAAVKTMEQ